MDVKFIVVHKIVLGFSIAAWANIPEKGIRQLEQLQGRCLRTVLGTKSHAATDAIEVIASVMPVRLRIQQLCVLEFTRIKKKPHNSRLQLSQNFISRSRDTALKNVVCLKFWLSFAMIALLVISKYTEMLSIGLSWTIFPRL